MNIDITKERIVNTRYKRFDELTPGQQTDRLDIIKSIEKHWQRRIRDCIPSNLRPPGEPQEWSISLLIALRSLALATPKLSYRVQEKLQHAVRDRPTVTSKCYICRGDVLRARQLINTEKIRAHARASLLEAEQKAKQTARKQELDMRLKALKQAEMQRTIEPSEPEQLRISVDNPMLPARVVDTNKNKATSVATTNTPPVSGQKDSEDQTEQLFEIKIKRLQLLHQQRQHELDILNVKEEQALYRQAKVKATTKTLEGPD